MANRCHLPTSIATNTSTWTCRSFHLARDRITALKLVFANWYNTPINGSVETLSGSAATYECSIEYPAGTFTRVTWNGATTIATASGDTTYSDWCNVEIPNGAKFYVRRRVSGQTKVVYNEDIHGAHHNAAQGDAVEENAGTNKVMTGTIADTYGNLQFFPLAILGRTRRPSIAIIGDSRQSGINDTADATGDVGELGRALGGNFAYISMGVQGEYGVNFINSPTRRLAIAKYCSHVVGGHGINDIVLGAVSAATMEARIQSLAALFAPRPYYHATIAPKTSGAWTLADGSDQTLDSTNSVRTTVNDWLRGALPAGLAGYIEVADAVELTHNGGKWKAPGYTTDGLHESTTGNTSIVVAPGPYSLRGVGMLPTY